MFPWIWFWAPHIKFPFSGSVAQDYRPTTDRLFGSIQDHAGDGAIEKKVFEDVASYGRQLGLITEVLVDLAKQLPPTTSDNRESLTRLMDIQTKVDALKTNSYRESIEDIVSMVKAIKAHGGQAADDLSAQLTSVLKKSEDQ